MPETLIGDWFGRRAARSKVKLIKEEETAEEAKRAARKKSDDRRVAQAEDAFSYIEHLFDAYGTGR